MGTTRREGILEELVGEDDEPVVSSEELEDTANRLQRVLKAFHEVTGVLAEVPKQIWMLPLRFGLLPGLKVMKGMKNSSLVCKINSPFCSYFYLSNILP